MTNPPAPPPGPDADPPAPSPRFHGYTMLAVSIIIAAASMPGQTVLLAVFNAPIRAALGLGVAEIGLCYTIGTIAAGLPLPWIGRFADRLGLRRVVGVVAVAFAGSLWALGLARGMVSLTAGFFLVRLLGQGALGMLSGHVLAMWFERRLGVMEAVKTIGFAIAAGLLPFPTLWLIEHTGWRTALPILGLAAAAAIVPLVLTVFRNTPADVGQHLDGDPAEHPVHDPLHGGPPPPGDPAFTLRQTMATRAFWVLLMATGLLGIIGTAAMFHIQSMLESAGAADPAGDADKALFPWPITLGISTVIGGWLVDRVHPRWLMPLGPILTLLACLLWYAAVQPGIPVPPVVTMALGMGMMGLGGGLGGAVFNPTVARYFGRTHHGIIRGVVGTALVAATGVGPSLAGLGFDLAGGQFGPVMLAFAALCIPVAALSLTLSKPTPPAR